MKRGFSTAEFLIGIIVSFFILELIVLSMRLTQNTELDYNQNDILAALQIYQVFNLSLNIEVSNEEIIFHYFEEEKKLSLINNKIIMSPGTVIYYTDVENHLFYLDSKYIYLKIKRKDKHNIFLIGEIDE